MSGNIKMDFEKKKELDGPDSVCIRIRKIVDVGESNNEIFSSIKYAEIFTRGRKLKVNPLAPEFPFKFLHTLYLKCE